jgi:hypothetical protein
MMNGNSAIRFREYESACDRLKAIFNQLETEEGRAAVLEKLSISMTRFNGDPRALETVGQAMAKAMKADAPKYLAGLIADAQAEVWAARDELVAALGADLESKFMKKGKGK